MILANENKARLAFVVTNDGAVADGKASNSITFSVQDSETGEALRNNRLVCIIKGQAIFTENKATLYSATTNNQGEVTVHVISEAVGLVNVSCFLANSPANVLNADVSFVKPLDAFQIHEIKTLNHTLYYGEPSVVWTGASFVITTRGGSGEVIWSVLDNVNDIELQATPDGAAQITVKAPFIGSRRVEGVDAQTQERIVYQFMVRNFVELVSQEGSLESVLIDANKQLLSKEIFSSLYQQWGNLASYEGWLPSNYWVDQYSIEANTAQVFNSKTGITTKQAILVNDVAKLSGIAYRDVTLG